MWGVTGNIDNSINFPINPPGKALRVGTKFVTFTLLEPYSIITPPVKFDCFSRLSLETGTIHHSLYPKF